MIGIDIEEVKRFALKKENAFIARTFTPDEIVYAYARTKPAMHLAGMFCVKEAYCKAIGRGVEFTTIEIAHEKSGKPYLRVKNAQRKTNSERRDFKRAAFAVSISHTAKHAIAVVLKNKKSTP